MPEIAARAHVEALGPLIEGALADAGKTLADVDAIAATAGPGLIGGVMVGLLMAKGLALAARQAAGRGQSSRRPCAVARGSPIPTLAFPYLLLLVSGGHCQLLLVEGVGRYRRLATTIDDAAGEAFDKTAKLLGLGLSRRPGGGARGGDGRSERGAPAPPAARLGRAAFLLRRPQERGAARARRRARTAPRTSPPPSSRRSSIA